MDPRFFDAERYVADNPSAGFFDCRDDRKAWRHFVSHRRHPVLGNGASREIAAHYETLAPYSPPPHLMARVHGAPDYAGFADVGEVAALDILGAASGFVDLRAPLRVLDLGCGCGRALYPLVQALPAATFFGSDIDAEAISWISRLPSSTFEGRVSFGVNAAFPPLDQPSGSFDLIYAISVITHLPADMQDAWMAEFSRLLKPDGVLVITSQNESWILPYLTPEVKDAFLKDGMHYHPYQSTEGLPDFYQAAWHTTDYLKTRWASLMTLKAHHRFGMNDHQDICVFGTQKA